MEDLGNCGQAQLCPPENKKPRLGDSAVVKNPSVELVENPPVKLVENPPVAMAAENLPVPTQAELGLCHPYLERWPLEDADEIDENIYYLDDDGKEDRPADIRGTHDRVKRFLKQVRESMGYDVDCCPPPCICSPFVPRNLGIERVRARAIQVAKFALEHINAETMVKFGKRYVLLDVEKAVDTLSLMVLLTFTAKEFDAGADADANDSDAPVKTIQAMVWVPPSHKPFEFEEWKFKPGCA